MNAMKRYGRPFQRNVGVTAANTLLANANPKRRAICLTSNDDGSVINVTVSLPGQSGMGFILNPQSPNLLITGDDFGRLSEAEFRATAVLQGAPPVIGLPFTNSLSQVSTAAAADLLIMSTSAGVFAVINWASVSNFTGGAPTILLENAHNGVTVILESVTAPSLLTPGIVLSPLDQLKWTCSVGVAGSKVDVLISGLSYPNIGAAPPSALVTVTEVED